jgi:KipI family sensor histidine kinase inhibitor
MPAPLLPDAAAAPARILPCGDQALTVQLSERLDEGVNRRVIALARDLAADPLTGVLETVPTYRALLVRYDPLLVRGAALAAALHQRLARIPARPPEGRGRLWRLPVVYGGPMGMDLDEVARLRGLTTDEVVRLHAAAEFRVYMIGFSPGYAYLGGLPPALHTPRRTEPRQSVPAGAVGIGGQQASINSVTAPSGWRFLGGTPVPIFQPGRADPFLLAAGDRVRFHPVSAGEAARIAAALARSDAPFAPDEDGA